MSQRLTKLLPFLVFCGIALALWVGLDTDTRRIPSVLINKPVPEFKLAAIPGSAIPGFATADAKTGQVTIINIFASWCVPCRQEHPLLMDLSARRDIKLVGINNKDKAAAALGFLGELGQPFAAIGWDVDGRVSINFGGYGVPETFIVDGSGIIRHKHIGPLDPLMMQSFNAEIDKARLPLAKDPPL
jgi:cytochrome c biogenesis protein CcmG, thiol:disulfide interchange protein DsbE